MQVSVSDAKAQLTELVRRAEAGEEVVLTRHGKPAVRLAAVEKPAQTADQRRAIIERISREAAGKATPGPCAARSQDCLYDDETGLPA